MRVITPTSWMACQYSSTIYIDGINLDMSAWNMTREGLYKWLKYSGVTPPGGDTDMDKLQIGIDCIFDKAKSDAHALVEAAK